MKNPEFLLFRLNFVDRLDLFPRPIGTDDNFIKVLEAAATERFDIAKQGPRSGYKWALREVIYGSVGDGDRPFAAVTLSYEITSRRGPIVTPGGITRGTSTVSPPAATLSRIFIDLRRHIFAIEDVPSIIQPRGGWKTSLQTILRSAAWHLNFTSMIQLDPVIPTEAVVGRLKTFDRVTRLRVTLRIPNPDLGPSFQKLYDEMKAGGIRELTEDMRNEGGLTLEPETLPQATLDMALKGYRKGKIHAYGYKDGKKEEIKVSDDIARIEMDLENMRHFVEGYAAGQKSAGVKHFAESITQRIDDAVRK